jgi:integrase/recombinase XerD
MPARDYLIFTLSFLGALRVCEIAQLAVDAMLGPRGEILDCIRIAPHMTKGSEGRSIPMHPLIREALADFLDVYPNAQWVAISPRDGRQMRAATLARAMERVFRDCGFPGCRSHSGRATCITELARNANRLGCTLKDVQEFAGHKRLETTASYLGPTDSLADLVAGLGNNSNKRRISYGATRREIHYWAPRAGVRSDQRSRRSGRPGAAGQPRRDGDHRRDEERYAERLQSSGRARRKLRQNRPFRGSR